MNIFKTIAEDVNNVKRLDPAAQSKFIIWLTYPACMLVGAMLLSIGCGTMA